MNSSLRNYFPGRNLLKQQTSLQQVLEKALADHPLSAYQIGRSDQNEIRLTDSRISGRHARLTRLSPTTYLLEDLDSKHGVFVNELRISRKIIDETDVLRFGFLDYKLPDLLAPDGPPLTEGKRRTLNYTKEFQALKAVYEQYPELRKACRNREKLIRTASIILSSIIGVGTVASSGGGSTLPVLQVMSGAGLGMLIPALSSSFLSTEEKLELLDKEYRELYRCPNPDCASPFGNREWPALARQKVCSYCKAVWVK